MTGGYRVHLLPLDQVRPNPHNPRRKLGDLAELALSIRDHGIMSPLLARRPDSDGEPVVLLAGHRRLAAARMVGLTEVPVIIFGRAMDSDEQLIKALVDNLHRADLSPMDEARACAALKSAGRSTHEIAEDVRRSRSWVSTRLALLELPPEVQAKVDAGELTVMQAAGLGWQLKGARAGSVHTVPRYAPRTFNRTHRLWPAARRVCDEAGHPRPGRVEGGACTQCWERAIRADERRAEVPA